MGNDVDLKTTVVIPNWNGADLLAGCINSLLQQTVDCHIIVVDNGSKDDSGEILKSYGERITCIFNNTNLGFAGGVNTGIEYALGRGFTYIALLNNDAVVDKDWLKYLTEELNSYAELGIATCTILDRSATSIDSKGEKFSVWGLPYPEGRGDILKNQVEDSEFVFGASGGASLYRVSMLKEIGLFDDDFFAYYEDVDISFRAQLAGWKVKYVPEAIAYHDTGSTSRKIKGFTTYQTMKNQPLVVFKNVPSKYLWRVTWRFTIAHTLFFLRAVSRGQGWTALKGDARGTYLLFKKTGERRRIQKTRKVSDEYIWSIMTHDLPPNATALRKLRSKYWKLTGKKS